MSFLLVSHCQQDNFTRALLAVLLQCVGSLPKPCCHWHEELLYQPLHIAIELRTGQGERRQLWMLKSDCLQVYNGQPSSVLAVEPSLEMSRLGQRMHAARLRLDGKAQSSSAEDAHRPDVRWASSLHGHGAASSARRKQPVRQGIALHMGLAMGIVASAYLKFSCNH